MSAGTVSASAGSILPSVQGGQGGLALQLLGTAGGTVGAVTIDVAGAIEAEAPRSGLLLQVSCRYSSALLSRSDSVVSRDAALLEGLLIPFL